MCPAKSAPPAHAFSASWNRKRFQLAESRSSSEKLVNAAIPMPEHHTPLIATIAAGLVLAYAFGLLAHRLRIQPLAGYVLAGVVVSPSTPGFHADSALAGELAEIGVILLMFGVGLHFSLKDLMAVARIVVPGAIVQIVVVTLLGAELGHLLGWSWTTGLVFGLALSVASTVVMVRAFQDRRVLDTERGRFAVGWLVVE